MGRKKEIIKKQTDLILILRSDNTRLRTNYEGAVNQVDITQKSNTALLKECKELKQDRDRCSKAYGEAKAELSRYRKPIIF